MMLKKLAMEALQKLGVKNRLDILLILKYWRFLPVLLKLFRSSKSQISQDVFAISYLKAWKNSSPGFFVEIGAADGVHLSNTYLLEKQFNWSGILSEPAIIWRKVLETNRSCVLDYRCVAGVSGKNVLFNQTVEPEYSTISNLTELDLHSKLRISGEQYEVQTVSLNDLLEEADAPRVIDYLSIDTEGSELQIIENFDFNKWQFRVITIEHNYTANRDKIFKLLESNGYKRVLSHYTKVDDWYVYLN